MKGLRLLLLLIILLILVLYSPLGVWAQLKRLWARGDYILGVLVFGVVLYLIYGVYSMYQQGMLDW